MILDRTIKTYILLPVSLFPSLFYLYNKHNFYLLRYIWNGLRKIGCSIQSFKIKYYKNNSTLNRINCAKKVDIPFCTWLKSIGSSVLVKYNSNLTFQMTMKEKE